MERNEEIHGICQNSIMINNLSTSLVPEEKREGERGRESLFEEMMTETSQIWGEIWEIQVHETNFMFQFKTILPKTNYSRTVSKIKNKKLAKQQEKISLIQENLHKVIHEFLSKTMQARRGA